MKKTDIIRSLIELVVATSDSAFEDADFEALRWLYQMYDEVTDVDEAEML